MNATTEVIKAIPPGEQMTFQCESPKAMNSAQAIAAYVRRTYPNPKIERFKCSKNWDSNEITITAIPSEMLN